VEARASLFTVVVGCGRLGSYLANKLSLEGHSLVVVDIEETAFDALSAEYSGFRVEGDATELAVLKRAKMDKADLVIAATGDDNVNLMTAQIAGRIFQVPRVLARIYDPGRSEIYRELGVDGICPTVIAGDVFLSAYAESVPRTAGEDQS